MCYAMILLFSQHCAIRPQAHFSICLLFGSAESSSESSTLGSAKGGSVPRDRKTPPAMDRGTRPPMMRRFFLWTA